MLKQRNRSDLKEVNEPESKGDSKNGQEPKARAFGINAGRRFRCGAGRFTGVGFSLPLSQRLFH
jgi:hypothetical protein